MRLPYQRQHLPPLGGRLAIALPLQPPPFLRRGWRGLVGKKIALPLPRVGWKVGREECGDNIRSHSLFNKLVMLNLILHSTYIYILLRNVLFLKKLLRLPPLPCSLAQAREKRCWRGTYNPSAFLLTIGEARQAGARDISML